MEEAFQGVAEFHEGRLDSGFDVHYLALVDVPYKGGLPPAFHVDLLEPAVLHDRDPALLGFTEVD